MCQVGSRRYKVADRLNRRVGGAGLRETRLLHPQTKFFRPTVRDHMGPMPAQIARTATVVDALNRMARASSSAVIVTDSLGRPAGIITEQEIVRRVAWRASPDQSVEDIMTTPVVSVSADDNLFHAILAMRRHRLRYIPVVDRAGVLAGLLELHQACFRLSGLLPLLIRWRSMWASMG